MSTIDPRLIFSFIWIVGVTAVMFWILTRAGLSLPPLRYAILVALIVRFVPALVLPRGAAYEMSVFEQAAETVRGGRNLFTTPIPYPYLPFQLYWFAVSDWLADSVGLFFIFWLKSINMVADTAVIFIIYHALSRLQNQKIALWGSWLYVFNPVTVLVSAYQGQFDATPLFFLLLSWYLFRFHAKNRRGLMLSAVFLGFGILSKTWPVLFLPIVFLRLSDWRSRIQFSIICGMIPLAGLIVFEFLFPGSWLLIIRRAMSAGAIPGWWGFSAPLNVFVELTGKGTALYLWVVNRAKLLSLLLGMVTILWTHKRPSQYSLLLTILVLFATVPNLGLQGLSWIVPLALINAKYNELGYYVLGSVAHMLVSYWGVHLTQGLFLVLPYLWAAVIIQLSSITAWIVILLWCYQEIWQRKLIRPFARFA